MPNASSFNKHWNVYFLLSILLVAFTACQTAQNPQELYTQYYQKPAFSEKTNGIRHMEAVKSVYEDSDYESSVRLLEKVKTNPRLRVYLGICYMELEQMDKATTLFSSLLADPDLKDKAGWYLALCHLQSGNTTNSKTELNKLATGNSKLKKIAGELLNKL